MENIMLTHWLYEGVEDSPLAKVAFECDGCGYSIYIGDEYYQIDSLNICDECILDHQKIAE